MGMNTDHPYSLFPWTAGRAMTEVPTIVSAEGIYLFDSDGNRYFDMNSGTVCVNIGHNHPEVLKAIRKYDGPRFVPLFSTTKPRQALEELLVRITPAEITHFAFFSEGSVAMEAAEHIAWGYFNLKRKKTITLELGFHGGTTDMLRRGGDPRAALIPESQDKHIIRISPPVLFYGRSSRNQMQASLEELDYWLAKCGDEIAAFIIEPVLGAAGAYTHPAGYLRKIRKMLDPYGILLIYDEALCGFGRTGKLFALEHEGVVPDILVMSKGLTSGYAPLSAVGVSKAIAEHYWDHPLPMGSTYFAHPFCCHVAHAAVGALLDEQLVENAAAMEHVVREEMEELTARHPSVKEGRILGLLGAVELQADVEGTPFPKSSPVVKVELASELRQRGILGSFRPSLFLFCPPLCVTEGQLREAFAIIHQSLSVTDRYVED